MPQEPHEAPLPRDEAITAILERLFLGAPTLMDFRILIRASLSGAYECGHAAACSKLQLERKRLEAEEP